MLAICKNCVSLFALQAVRSAGKEQHVIRHVHAKGLQNHYNMLKRKAAVAEAHDATAQQAACMAAFPHLYSGSATATAPGLAAAAAGAVPTAAAQANTSQPGLYAPVQQLLLQQQLQLQAYAMQQLLLQQLAQQPGLQQAQQASKQDATDREKAAQRYQNKKRRRATQVSMGRSLLLSVMTNKSPRSL
jgi:hypothetical protein